ncbi:MAG: lysozyme [Gemmatimonadaceae bacterium]
MNAAGLELLKHFEGWRSRAYPDPATGGKPWSIGYGFTKGVQPGDVMTLEEGEERLKHEVAEFEDGLAVVPANENQHAAMTCLAYNIGLGNFRVSSVRRFHNLGQFERAADAFLLWIKAAGKVMPGLFRRRRAERSLYLE